MSRLATYLAAVMLAFSQPLAMACECRDCAGACSTQPAVTASHKACCATSAESGRSCCGAPAGECPCGTSHSPDGPASTRSSTNGATENAPCLCSADVPTTAVTADAVSVNQSPDVAYFLPPSAAVAVDGRFGDTLSVASPHGPPDRFAGLRAHAYLRVWLI
jgi:hypothetical protein